MPICKTLHENDLPKLHLSYCVKFDFIKYFQIQMTYLLDKCLDTMHVIAQVALPISNTSGKTSSHCLKIGKNNL